MRASTEEFLYVMLWTAESLLRPSWQNALDPSFERWAWRNGLTRRLAQLERRKLLEQHPASHPTERVVRLTEAGRLAALGGRDPVERWARAWDGSWRIMLFDLPSDQPAPRIKLHRLLRGQRFGYLQNSAWITPDPVNHVRELLHGCPMEPEGFVVFEGRPATGETDEAIVRGAWDFAEINRGYEAHREVLSAAPARLTETSSGRERLHLWARREHAAWKKAVSADPLLPLALLPPDYLGRSAWASRRETISELVRALRAHPSFA